MASHPYISGPGNIAQMILLLRKNFPATVTSETVKKFSIAPKNESYVINALQFSNLIDDDGKRTEKGQDVFVMGDGEFSTGFRELVTDAYADLFELRGEDAWNLTKDELKSYFRTTDKTSAVIGGRQAAVFDVFRSFADKELSSDPKASQADASVNKPKKSVPKQAQPQTPPPPAGKQLQSSADKNIALTVRLEINLPENSSQQTYDNIFKSLKANLLDD